MLTEVDKAVGPVCRHHGGCHPWLICRVFMLLCVIFGMVLRCGFHFSWFLFNDIIFWFLNKLFLYQLGYDIWIILSLLWPLDSVFVFVNLLVTDLGTFC